MFDNEEFCTGLLGLVLVYRKTGKYPLYDILAQATIRGKPVFCTDIFDLVIVCGGVICIVDIPVMKLKTSVVTYCTCRLVADCCVFLSLLSSRFCFGLVWIAVWRHVLFEL